MNRSSVVITGLLISLSISMTACVQNGPAISTEHQIDQPEEKLKVKPKATMKSSVGSVDSKEAPEKPNETVVEIIEETLAETEQSNESKKEKGRE